MKSRGLCFVACLLCLSVLASASPGAIRRRGIFDRRSGLEDVRLSYFGGGPLVLEYDRYSGVSDRSSSGGLQFVGGLQWDYVGLEVRLAPGSVSGGHGQFSFKFDGTRKRVELDLDHRLYILAKPVLPIGPVVEPYGWVYGLAGPGFGEAKTESEPGGATTKIEANEADLVYGFGLAVPSDRYIFQVDLIRNLDRDDAAFTGLYFGLHRRFR